jgi:hypothetical protein
MTTLQQINIATFDDTSVEDFELLMRDYLNNRSNIDIEASKKRYQELVDAAVDQANRYYKSGE